MHVTFVLLKFFKQSVFDKNQRGGVSTVDAARGGIKKTASLPAKSSTSSSTTSYSN